VSAAEDALAGGDGISTSGTVFAGCDAGSVKDGFDIGGVGLVKDAFDRDGVGLVNAAFAGLCASAGAGIARSRDKIRETIPINLFPEVCRFGKLP
jgi:hypothetical protein